jgi:hypothetical protein
MTAGRTSRDEPLPPELALAFAPLHKRAFGVAVGAAAAAVVFLLTAIFLLRGQETGGPSLWLLQNYFYGYRVSWPGALVGALWGFVAGFVAGWFFAFCRNFAIAVAVFLVRTRAELAASRDFLDHI